MSVYMCVLKGISELLSVIFCLWHNREFVWKFQIEDMVDMRGDFSHYHLQEQDRFSAYIIHWELGSRKEVSRNGWSWKTELVCSGCHNKEPQTGWLTQQKCMFSHLWRFEVRDQASRVGFFWRLLSLGADGCLLSVCSYDFLSVYVCLNLSSYKDRSHIGLGPPIRSCFTSTASLKDLSPNTVTLWGSGS
jgi:hypothetical protein